MSKFSGLCLLLIVAALALVAVPMQALAKGGGWNSQRISYVSYQDALTQAKIQQKPILFLVHKSWCAACKQMRAQVEQSAEIEALSEHFVMAHAEDDDEPTDAKLAPHGAYSPRVLFLGSSGDVLPITNPVGSDPSSPHFYGSAPELVRGMVAALAHVGVQSLDELSA
jgi:protein-disulfide reductase (glutathione)